MKPLAASLCVFSLALSAAALGAVYKVVDDSGRVTYTDKPPASEQGERVKLPTINTQPGIEIAPKPLPSPEPDPGDYQRLEIVEPRNGASIPPGQLDLVIQVAISPELQPGHRIAVLMDGKRVAPPAAATSIRLDTLERGSHRIEARVIDDAGSLVASTKPVNIYVHRASKLIKPKANGSK
ncbi:MAG: DUF4124 domain-containing protein [Porticoccaceae bacterium]|nr:DUF4124 domain-containing protein [Porticoccaceae bacterium]